MDWFDEHFAWMAWTWQTTLFFGGIAAALIVLTVLAVLRPETPRPGVLVFATTRGDRFFVSLILAAFIFLASIKLGVENPIYPSATALLIAALMFRFAGSIRRSASQQDGNAVPPGNSLDKAVRRGNHG